MFSNQQLSDISAKLGLSSEFISDRLKVNQRRHEIIADILKKRDVDLSSASILEVGSHIGCGLLMVDSSAYITGLEYYYENCVKAKMLATALNKKSIFYVQGNAADLPYRSNEFDFVQSHHVIEHMPRTLWPKYIKEMGRVLKPNGVCFLSYPQFFYPIESHYKLPFLHWLPVKLRPYYARLTPHHRHVREAEKTYQQTVESKDEITFTEFPKVSEINEMAERWFSWNEDVTREFINHHRVREILNPLNQKIASLLAKTWLCPDRKVLLFGRHS
jgi:ubiquinone/menaquinone biosynthesis C-methylase UbiE